MFFTFSFFIDILLILSSLYNSGLYVVQHMNCVFCLLLNPPFKLLCFRRSTTMLILVAIVRCTGLVEHGVPILGIGMIPCCSVSADVLPLYFGVDDYLVIISPGHREPMMVLSLVSITQEPSPSCVV